MEDQIRSSVVQKVVDYLADLVVDQFSYLFCYNGNLEEFKSRLTSLEMKGRDVKLLVEDAERKGEVILPSVEDWLKEVDEFTNEWKPFVAKEDAISKGFFKDLQNLSALYNRSKNAKRKALQCAAIEKRAKLDSVSCPAPPLQIEYISNKNEVDFESRRSVFYQIMDAIKDDEVGIIGIWGMPGIGKTTLVKKVGRHAKDEGLFEMVAMAVVSQEPSIEAIQGRIADGIGFKFTSESREGRAGQLFQRLQAMKKILVILDDIWKGLELNDIGIPSGNQYQGCKIILTSRNENLCKEMRAGKIFKIDLLGADEALSLFLHMSGVDDRSSYKGRLAKKLSEECRRLPIAIVLVARGLLNRDLNDWKDMLNRLRNSDPDERLYKIIKSSYDYLGRKEEKLFFLLCALFPEDYEIPVQVLFEYGIGLNLFEKVDKADEKLVRAHKLALSLKSSNLLLDGWSDEFVKMHDVVRDVALAIASEENHAFVVGSTARWREWREKKAISLWSDDIKKFPDAFECPQLQILTLNCSHPDFQLNDNFFVGMRNLLVLDMSGMEFVQWPESIAGLENLLTLRLRTCILGDISAIGKLQNLVSLSFYDSNIEVLPKEVGELRNLRLLDLSRCKTLKVITPGVIQNLSQLEVLCVESNILWSNGKEVCRPKNASLSELIHLSRLMILKICIRDASMLPDEVLFENLTKFDIWISKADFSPCSDISCPSSQILNLIGLSENVLSKSGIKRLIKRAQHLNVEKCTNLQTIYMSKEEEHDEVIVFPQLSHLKLWELKNLASFCSKFTSESTLFCKQVILPALEKLEIYRLEKVEKIWHIHTPVESFFQLKVLKLIQCPQLLSVFPPQSTSPLQNLEELCVEHCSLLEILFQSDSVPLAEGKEVILFPRLITLRLIKLPNLTAILNTTSPNISQATVNFPILKTIHLEGLNSIKNIWHDKVSTKCFGQLQQLHVSYCNQLVEVFPCHLIPYLHCLEEVTIKGCNLLEKLFQLDYCPVGENKIMTILKRLKILNLEVLPELRQIWWIDDQRLCGVQVLFPVMEAMTLRKLHDLESMVVDQHLLTSLPKLMKLELENNNRLSWIVDLLPMIQGVEALEELIIKDTCLRGKENLQVIATLPKLRKLKFCLNMESIEWTESLNQSNGFQSLTSLNFSYCNGLKCLLTPTAVSCLAQLQKLFVNTCESMESIVEETNEEHKVIEFSKLHTLSLDYLPCLASFYNGKCALKFPSLGDCSIRHCSRLKMFISMSRETPETSCHDFVSEALFGQQVSFGRLTHLTLEQLDLMEEIWHPEHPATAVGELRMLRVKCCDKLSKIFPSNLLPGLQNLAKLRVQSCESLEHVFAVEDHPPLLSNLQELELDNLPKMKQLWWNKNTYESFGLTRLCSFEMRSCSALRFVFDASVADHLENLVHLIVVDCSSIVEIAPEKSGEKIVFPRLEFLDLVGLPCFKGFNQSLVFPQAFAVHVDARFNMKELRQNKKQFSQSTMFYQI